MIWIIANWKSHKSVAEALDWIGLVGPHIPTNENLKVVVCPPFTDLAEVKTKILTSGFKMMVGSQDLSPFPEGAYTGEEAASILKDVVELAILGHSERRKNFNETDEMIAAKVSEAREYNILPLVCVQSGDTPVPEGVRLVAYEPVFAIGTGNADDPAEAEDVAKKLKGRCGQELEVLYGGSVNSENAQAFLKQENLSGLLIGTASLEADEFIKILEVVSG